MIEPEPLRFIGLNQVRHGRRTLDYFSGCDYFRLARDPRLARAAARSLWAHGLNVAASRRTTGNHHIYAQLEADLTKFSGAQASLVLPDGYFAPIVTAQALAGEFTHVLIDELAHGALLDAAKMLDCPIKFFKHRSPPALAGIVASCGKRTRPMVLTDGMFSHDGSVAPLKNYLKVLPANAFLLVDDAHGVGVLGASGQGSLEYAGVNRQRIIQCVTLSKAFGVYGGAVLTSRALREKIIGQSRAFAGTTPLPPPLAGAAIIAIRIFQAEPSRRKKLRGNVAYLRKQLRAGGWDLPEMPGPIVRLPSLDEFQAGALRKRLLAASIYPPFIRYGKASAGGFFRFVIASEHTRAQLDNLSRVLISFRAQCGDEKG